MKKLNKILFILLVFVINVSLVYAGNDKNLVNIYLFHSDTCPHCKEEIKFLDDIKNDYDNIKIYMYEIGDSENVRLLNELADLTLIKRFASDGPSDYMRRIINAMDEETFSAYLDFHLKTCERKELLGASSHVVDILKI